MPKYLFLRPIFILLSLTVLGSCESNGVQRHEVHSSLNEIKRILSPDKKTEAVLIEDQGDATVANFIQVYIVLPGVKITVAERQYFIFNADHYSDINIEWKADRKLVIEYAKARIFKFTNFWQDEKLDNWNYTVEIALNCTSHDGQLANADLHSISDLQMDTTTVLEKILPIDSIVGIIVNNFNGKHKLSLQELKFLKPALKNAKFAGGLLIKPNHIILEIQMTPKTPINPGLVYASLGQIHFDGIHVDGSVVS